MGGSERQPDQRTRRSRERRKQLEEKEKKEKREKHKLEVEERTLQALEEIATIPEFLGYLTDEITKLRLDRT